MCDICHNVIMFVVLLEIQCSRRDVSKHSSDVIFLVSVESRIVLNNKNPDHFLSSSIEEIMECLPY